MRSLSNHKTNKWQIQIRVNMCNCPKVHFYEVDFKLAGMRVMPTHKNCGDSLNEDQSSKFEKELIKYWGFEEKG